MRQAAQRKLRILLIALLGCAAIAAAAFRDEERLAYEIWRDGAPGIAQEATEEATSIATYFWPPASAVCRDPRVGAVELTAGSVTSPTDAWGGGAELVRQSGSFVLHQRQVFGDRWDPGWMVQSITVNGTLEGVEVRRLRLGPTDGPAPSTYAVYDGKCRLIGASHFRLVHPPENGRSWRRLCFGPGWVLTDCATLEARFDALARVSARPLEVIEQRCYGAGLTEVDRCLSDIATYTPPIGMVESYAWGL